MPSPVARAGPQVHDPKSGRLDGIAFAKILGVSTPLVGKMIGVSLQGLRQTPASPRIQGKLARLVSLVLRVRHMFGGDMGVVKIWLNAPHPDLGRVAPMRYLMEGYVAEVESLVYACESGQPD
ncbi:MAG TPA: antitoxin Xre/MbcA/ParS toxin-binding domain-containing protein [Candidatus Eremiobacteraceae bacterium]|nr:antitoxin Xre/MbcA/ParS toxin-binding domain-containing protein [Candidatus Eremiobacteraceae bacterium]